MKTGIEKQFIKMGADVKVVKQKRDDFSVNVADGVFSILTGDKIDVQVVDTNVKDRHLVLNIIDKTNKNPKFHSTHKFLCGHDERDWFIASVNRGKNVREAKESLKPQEVIKAEANLRGKVKNKRKNKARVRQGEWFFIPQPNLSVDVKLIHKNEPISRGGGSKPHMVEELYRTGGETVYVSNSYPNGLVESEYKQLLLRNKSAKKSQWTVRVRNAAVYARGAIRHKDHATIYLTEWHQVLMNTESGARARGLAFLD